MAKNETLIRRRQALELAEHVDDDDVEDSAKHDQALINEGRHIETDELDLNVTQIDMTRRQPNWNKDVPRNSA